ncbi:MAG: ABC transporter permease [Anaerolineae bacterium]|nr:ABC transporter permease [Anaerolineae bacterium]
MAAESNITNLKGASDEHYASPSLLQLALGRLWRDRLSMIALTLLLLLTVSAYGAPIITQLLGVNPNSIVGPSFLPPGVDGHLLGLDDIGRDHLARLLYAGQISLKIGFLAAFLSLVIGVSLGLATGYFGGIVDDITIWLITTINSIPLFFIILIIAAILSPDDNTLIIVLGFLGWTSTTRLVRGETLSLREREFVISARAIGATRIRIMFAHILPNLISIILINLAIDIGVIILVEAGLSFLGVGVKPPTATWGNMLTNAQTFFTRGPHLVFWPGFMIFLTVLCLYVLGDGLRDAFDPTTVDQ